MLSKNDIQHYLDPCGKGYMSLCDIGRILSHVLIWLCIIFGPGAIMYLTSGTRYSLIVCCITMCVLVIFGLIGACVLIFISICICDLVTLVYNKYLENGINTINKKYKPCKIKVINLK